MRRLVLFREASGGFTLLETMMAAAVCALLLALAVPTYRGIMDRMKVSKTTQDLMRIASALQRHRTAHDGDLPDSLDQLNGIPRQDPWNGDYQYLNFASNIPGIKGKIRKDHNLHPLNTEFDLYSKGPDGDSNAPLTSSKSRDDIIWARDGGFVGKAKDF